LSTAGDSVHVHRREGYPDPLETEAPPSSSPPCSPLAWLCRRHPLAASWRRARWRRTRSRVCLRTSSSGFNTIRWRFTGFWWAD